VSRIRGVLVGLGAMNSIALKRLLDREVEIVGAVARSREKVGKDVGVVAGLDRRLGVDVTDDLVGLLEVGRPDIAVIATASYLTEVEEQLASCARAGVNAITLAEEMLYPWRTAPEASRRLDDLARANGVTLTGGGFQDVYLVHLVSALLGSAHRVDQVVGLSTFDVDDFGPEIARDQQVGKTAAEFGLWLRETERPPSFGGNVLDALASMCRLTVTAAERTTQPIFAEGSMYCRALELDVAPGEVIGFADTDVLRTAEGPVLKLGLSGRLFRKGEKDVNDWRVLGDPALRLVNPEVDTQSTTCTQLVNRIPDVIDAAPGLVTIAELPPPRLRFGPFGLGRR
jgi:hypothetical protein